MELPQLRNYKQLLNKNERNKKMKNNKNLKFKKGFTLIEMLVVVTIIGILSTVLYTSYSKYIKNSREAVVKAEIQEICESLEVAMVDHQTIARSSSDAYDTTNFVSYDELFNAMVEGGFDNDELGEIYELATENTLGAGAVLSYKTASNVNTLVYSKNGVAVEFNPKTKQFVGNTIFNYGS